MNKWQRLKIQYICSVVDGRQAMTLFNVCQHQLYNNIHIVDEVTYSKIVPCFADNEGCTSLHMSPMGRRKRLVTAKQQHLAV